MITDMLDTFFSRAGTLFDPYAGAMSVACASVITGRSATREADEQLFRVAASRLLHVANAKTLDDQIRSGTRDREA